MRRTNWLWAAGLLIAPAVSADVQWDGASHLDQFDRSPIVPIDGESFTVRFQVFDLDLTSARAAVIIDGSPTWIEASYLRDRGIYDVWSATIPATTPTTQLEYYFELTDGADVDYLGPSGVSDDPPPGGWLIDFATLSHAPLGAHLTSDGGAVFKVWAAGASSAHVAGEFNGWSQSANPMTPVGTNFIARVPSVELDDMYKYVFNRPVSTDWRTDARSRAVNPNDNYNSRVKSAETFNWTDDDFTPPPFEEMIIYQLHVGTFSGRNDGSNNDPGTYRDVVDLHLDHLVDLGINVVQLMPITEFAADHSGGYNPASTYSPESAYGTPDDLKYMINRFHDAGIAVTLDVVFNHLGPSDDVLWNYSGSSGASTQIYYDGDGTGGTTFSTPWGPQPDFDRSEVAQYFIDAALYWTNELHMDGFRFDATDFMHPPNGQGSGFPLLAAINDQLDRRSLDKAVYAEQLPDNSYFTRPTANGGAGFDFQYHDRHKYALRNAVFDAAFNNANVSELRETILGRLNDSGNHRITDNIDGITQSTANLLKYFELHDEAWGESGGQRAVKTIDTSFPHDDAFARNRTLVAHAVNFFSPGVPAFLMGCEFLEDTDFGANAPSTPESRLDWTKPTTYASYLQAFKDMIRIRKENPGFRSNAGVEINRLDEANDLFIMHRWDGSGNDLMVVISLDNSDHAGYRIGLPQPGTWFEIFNSQATDYGGSGLGNSGSVTSEAIAWDGYAQSAQITIPRMSTTVLRLGLCALDTECDDGNDCTVASCTQGQCQFAERAVDITALTDCLEGPDTTPAPSLPGGCVERCLGIFDADQDGDVDLMDFNVFQDASEFNSEIITFESDAAGWVAAAGATEGYALDSFYPGLAGSSGGLSGAAASLTLASSDLNITLSNGQPAIRDASGTPQVSDAQLLPGATSVWTFDPPIFGLYTYYGSLNNASTATMRVFGLGNELAALTRQNGGSQTAAFGHGFLSNVAVDRVELSFTGTDSLVLVGAFVGVDGAETNLGTIEIPGYAGPDGETVELDFAIAP